MESEIKNFKMTKGMKIGGGIALGLLVVGIGVLYFKKSKDPNATVKSIIADLKSGGTGTIPTTTTTGGGKTQGTEMIPTQIAGDTPLVGVLPEPLPLIVTPVASDVQKEQAAQLNFRGQMDLNRS